jgi:reductive dehalogenase
MEESEMSKLHSTVSRRDFMKALGLAGAGVGAAAAATPVFKDLDQLAATHPSYIRRPWYIRDVDQPTAEVDWGMMTRFDNRELMFNPGSFIAQIGQDEFNRLNAQNSARRKEWVQEARPGFSLRDVAVSGATGFGYAFGMQASFTAEGGERPVGDPAFYDAPPWSGTPEENLRLLRAALRFFGARDVGVTILDQDTRKLIYGIEADGKAYEFADIDEPVETDTTRVIPNKAMYLVTFTTMESQEMLKHAPDQLSSAAVALGYAQGALVSNRIQQFLRGIGYRGLGEVRSNALAASAGCVAMSGVGEVSRMSMTSFTPEYGPGIRVFKMITDLPLAPISPIDAGMFRFCRTCKLCADACPSQAIQFETDPSFNIQGPWNKPGVKYYYYDAVRCLSYWREVTTGCGLCRNACPFLTKGSAIIHEVIKATTAITPLFNSVFATMGEVFGYTKENREERQSWWEIDEMPVYGFNTTRGTNAVEQ